MSQTFRYAAQRGLCTHNPASDMRDILPTPEEKHHACIPVAEFPELLQKMAAYKGDRVDHPTKPKFMRPLHKTLTGKFVMGDPEWIKSSILKPLYNQQPLSQHPKAQVWIVEGEKCTDKLNDIFDTFGIFGEHIAITSGSATSGEKADLKLFHGRHVSIWPDNDREGHPATRTQDQGCT